MKEYINSRIQQLKREEEIAKEMSYDYSTFSAGECLAYHLTMKEFQHRRDELEKALPYME